MGRPSDGLLAVDGPILKLPKIESQTYIDSMSDALREAGTELIWQIGLISAPAWRPVTRSFT
jgi:hypothetical protein